MPVPQLTHNTHPIVNNGVIFRGKWRCEGTGRSVKLFAVAHVRTVQTVRVFMIAIMKKPISAYLAVATQDSTRRVGRRGFLSGVGAAGGGVIGLFGTAAGSDIEDNYRTVIDVVEAGADNEGNESITPTLREHRGNDTLLKFPEGRYYMDSQFRYRL